MTRIGRYSHEGHIHFQLIEFYWIYEFSSANLIFYQMYLILIGKL